MKAYKHLVKHALKQNLVISVWDGEGFQVKKSTKYTDIIDAIESVEEAVIRIRDLKIDKLVAFAVVSAYDLADDETVIDCSNNEFMSQWDASYNAKV